MSVTWPEPSRLADSLELMIPALAPELVDDAAIPWLRAAARVLPPIHRAGFECRLAADAQEVDLQQGIFADDGEPAELAYYLARSDFGGEAWQQVKRLAERWAAAESPLATGLEEVWLELDAAPARGCEPLGLDDFVPSVFGLIRQAGASDSLAIGLAFLEALLGEQAGAGQAETVRRFAAACSGGARISHIGVMLGRPVAAMRVHVSPLPLTDIAPYLARVGWPGDPDAIAALATELLDYVDLVVLCLDIVDGRVLRIGLEGTYAKSHGLDPRWPALLRRLDELGLGSQEKASALVAWPSVLSPLDAPAPWPDDLIARSLTRGERELGVIDRRLSHVKLSVVPGQAPSAKAYFGYGHLWQAGRRAGDPEPPSRPARPPAATVPEAIERAVGYTLAKRTQGGWWRDFFGTPDVDFSDEWVTAYVGHALARTDLERATAAAREALMLLLTAPRRAEVAGWGYHVLLPPDGDATTWVLRLARSLGVTETERIHRGRSLLAELTRPDGGILCYSEDDAPAVDRLIRVGGSYAGWCNAHQCINAPAAALRINPATISFLRASQRDDGSWPAYWWDADEYATAWAVEALAADADHRAAVDAALNWCADRVSADGAVYDADREPSPFATALALYALHAGGADISVHAEAAARAERWLLEQQLDDGSWRSSARLRVPAPSAHNPSPSPEVILRYLPDSGLWTTATVLAALSGAASRR
ncbi:MAG TPA: prenyltransferase/squalene oxidase repeat-containing protein [Solirubrobacteraceae bacterium]|nr:prenyltransferase/squalene oxidase repeat-containing protein [Solirubrobacteraceae bacterium]